MYQLRVVIGSLALMIAILHALSFITQPKLLYLVFSVASLYIYLASKEANKREHDKKGS